MKTRKPMSRIVRGLLVTIGVAALVVPTDANAQISTDRPAFVSATSSLPAGNLQLEMGTLFESSDADYTTVGEGLVRWGVTNRLEARLEVPSYNIVDIPGSDESLDGFGDSGAGFKYEIGPFDEAGTFELIAIAMVSIPTGDDAFTSDEFDPEMTLAASKAIGPSVSLLAQVGGAFQSGGGDGDREFVWSLAGGSTTVLGSIGVFAEVGVESYGDGNTPVYLHTGFTFPLGRMAQFDVHGAIGLSDAASDTFVGAGFAFGG